MTSVPSAEEDRVGDEQADYARLLDLGGKGGLIVLVASFFAALTDLMPSSISSELLVSAWSQPLPDYLSATGAPTGWDWIFRVQHGDFASLAGVVLMAGCSLPCLCVAARTYLSRHDHLYAGICLLEIAVLLLAASGFLSVGG